MKYKIKKHYNRNGPRNPFYINVADFHLPRPQDKSNNDHMVDGHPIIFIDIGAAQ